MHLVGSKTLCGCISVLISVDRRFLCFSTHRHMHGSMCAGVIAAEAGKSNTCGVGLAYNARIGGMISYEFL